MKAVLYNRILVFLGFLGIFIAGVLSLAELFGTDVPCGPSHGCAIVAQDPSSHMLGIPNAYIGLLGYILLAVLASSREYTGFSDKMSIKGSLVLTTIGFIVSIGLQLFSEFRIHAICVWCFSSAVVMTIMFIVTILLAKAVKVIDPATEEKIGPGSGKAVQASYLVPILAVLAFGALGYQGVSMQPSGAIRVDTSPELIKEMQDPSGHVINPNGKMTIVEFGDLVCPFCHKLYPQVENIVKQSNGQIRFIFHNFPLFTNPEHKDALPAAFLGEMTTEKGQFFQFVHAVYTTPPSDTTKNMVTLDQVYNVLASMGYNVDALKARLLNMTNDPNTTDPAYVAVHKDLNLAAKLNVMTTPTYYIFAPGEPEQMISSDKVIDLLNSPAYHKYWGSGTASQ